MILNILPYSKFRKSEELTSRATLIGFYFNNSIPQTTIGLSFSQSPLPLGLKIINIEDITGPKYIVESSNVNADYGASHFTYIHVTSGTKTITYPDYHGFTNVIYNYDWRDYEGHLAMPLVTQTSDQISAYNSYMTSGSPPHLIMPPSFNDSRFNYGIISNGTTLMNKVASFFPGKIYNNPDLLDEDDLYKGNGYSPPKWTTDTNFQGYSQDYNSDYFGDIGLGVEWVSSEAGGYLIIEDYYNYTNYVPYSNISKIWRRLYQLHNGTVIGHTNLTNGQVPVNNIKFNVKQTGMMDAWILSIYGSTIIDTNNETNSNYESSAHLLWRGYNFGPKMGGQYRRWPDPSDMLNYGISPGPAVLKVGDVSLDKNIIDLSVDDPKITVICDDPDTYWAVYDPDIGVVNHRGSGNYSFNKIRTNWSELMYCMADINGEAFVFKHVLNTLDLDQYTTFNYFLQQAGGVVSIDIHINTGKLYVVWMDNAIINDILPINDDLVFSTYQQHSSYPIQFSSLLVKDGDTLKISIKQNNTNQLMKYNFRIGSTFFVIVQDF
jgi:hypothetical protein